jgi:hypothetical protein
VNEADGRQPHLPEQTQLPTGHHINRVKEGSPHPRPRQRYRSSARLHTLVALHGPGMRPARSAQRRGAHGKKAMLWHSQMRP